MTVPSRWARCLPVILGTHVRKLPLRTISLAAYISLCSSLIDFLALQHTQPLASRDVAQTPLSHTWDHVVHRSFLVRRLRRLRRSP